VARSIFVGDQIEVIVRGETGQIIVQLPSGQPLPSEGAEVAVVWPARDTLFFPRDAA
jgi:putative spermidine/putrescine transport system ATP-binding protein